MESPGLTKSRDPVLSHLTSRYQLTDHFLLGTHSSPGFGDSLLSYFPLMMEISGGKLSSYHGLTQKMPLFFFTFHLGIHIPQSPSLALFSSHSSHFLGDHQLHWLPLQQIPVMPPSSHPSQISGLSLLRCKPAHWMEPLECSVHPQIGLCRWLSGKEPSCQCRRLKRLGFNLWVRKIPWRRE